MLLWRKTSRGPAIGWDAISTLRRRILVAASLTWPCGYRSDRTAGPGDDLANMGGTITIRPAGSSAGGLGGNIVLVGIVLVIVAVLAIAAVAYRRARRPPPPQ